MNLKALQSRIIVKPDTPEYDGLLVIPETIQKPPAMSGTVVAVGHGPASARQVRSATYARAIAIVEELIPTAAVRNSVLDALAHVQVEATASELAIGDTVCFSYTAGHKMDVDGEKYIVLTEDECLAVWRADESPGEQVQHVTYGYRVKDGTLGVIA